MKHSHSHLRRLLPAVLVSATALIILATIWSLGPDLGNQLRRHSIERALANTSGPAFWWPSSWRAEYENALARRVMDSAVVQYFTALDLTSSRLSSIFIETTAIALGEDTDKPHNGNAENGNDTDRPPRLAVIRNVPEFQLTDQSGEKFRSSQLQGKVALLSFIFTTCSGSCPATTHRMSLVQRELKARGLLSDSQIHLVSITLDPARDTPEVLRGYMRLYDASPDHWSFLTGPNSEVEKVVDAWGMWARPAPNGQLDHPSRIFLIDTRGRIREIYNLGFMNPEWVADDIKLLLDEASREQLQKK